MSISKELKDENKVAIWLSYFISDSRKKGRRVRKLPFKITLNMLVDIAKELNLDPVVIENKAYPRDRRYGVIIVNKVKSKNYTIKYILSRLSEKEKSSESE
ncbi:MAG: signal recognition particle protein Srp19 [Sulfolobaceae archaeon]|nr:signal recognition particle protein Srp19 [Sulfolobaceae archaeon]